MFVFFLEWSINKYLTVVTLTHNVALKTQIIYLGYSLRQTDRQTDISHCFLPPATFLLLSFSAQLSSEKFSGTKWIASEEKRNLPLHWSDRARPPTFTPAFDKTSTSPFFYQCILSSALKNLTQGSVCTIAIPFSASSCWRTMSFYSHKTSIFFFKPPLCWLSLLSHTKDNQFATLSWCNTISQ